LFGWNQVISCDVADRLLGFGRNVLDGGGEEVGGFEDFEVSFGVPTAAGAVDDGLGGGVPVDFLEGEGRPQEIFRKALAAMDVVGSDRFVSAIDVEAAVFPGEEIGRLAFAEVFAGAEGLEETVSEQFGEGEEVLFGHAVKAPFIVKQAGGGEEVEVGVENKVVPEGVEGGGSGYAPGGQGEAGAEGITQAAGSGLEKEVEEMAALAEDSAQDLGNGKDELAVGDGVADGSGDPFARLADAALVAGRAEVPGLAGESQEPFVAAVRAKQAGEAGGEIATAEEGTDGGNGIGAQGTHGGAVVPFVFGEEIVPGVVDDLPQR
jgi:hypothetical protein